MNKKKLVTASSWAQSACSLKVPCVYVSISQRPLGWLSSLFSWPQSVRMLCYFME